MGSFDDTGAEQAAKPLSDSAWRERTAVTGACCLIVVAGFVGLGLLSHTRQVQLREEGLIVPGKVVSVDPKGRNHHAEIEFVTLAGEHVRTTAWRPTWPRTEVGDTWQVRYNPHDPSWYPEDVRVPDDTHWPVSAVMGFFAGFGVCAWWVSVTALNWGRTPSAAARAKRRRRRTTRPQGKAERLEAHRRRTRRR